MAMKAKYEKVNQEQNESVYICVDNTVEDNKTEYDDSSYNAGTENIQNDNVSVEQLYKTEANEHTKLYRNLQAPRNHSVMNIVKKFLSVMYSVVLRFRNTSNSHVQGDNQKDKQNIPLASHDVHTPSTTLINSLVSTKKAGTAVRKYLQLPDLHLSTSTTTLTSNISPGLSDHKTIQKRPIALVHSYSTPSVSVDSESTSTKLKSKSFNELDKVNQEETPLKGTQLVNYSTNQTTEEECHLKLGMAARSGTLPVSPSYSYLSWATLEPLEDDTKYCWRIRCLDLGITISYIMFAAAFVLSIVLVLTVKRDFSYEFRNGGMFG